MMNTQRSFPIGHTQCGAALAETVIIMPVFLILALGIVQWMLIYQARSTINYATLMAARAGAVSSLNQEKILQGLGRGLAPLFALPSPSGDPTAFFDTLNQITTNTVEPNSEIRILNPTVEAFNDHGRMNLRGVREIVNDRLQLRPAQVGGTSRVNIQDANILKLKVVYCHEMVVPFANSVIATVSSWFTTDAFAIDCLVNKTRIPILATAIVRMQSPPEENDWVMSLRDIEDDLSTALTPFAGDGSRQGHRPWESGPTGQN